MFLTSMMHIECSLSSHAINVSHDFRPASFVNAIIGRPVEHSARLTAAMSDFHKPLLRDNADTSCLTFFGWGWRGSKG